MALGMRYADRAAVQVDLVPSKLQQIALAKPKAYSSDNDRADARVRCGLQTSQIRSACVSLDTAVLTALETTELGAVTVAALEQISVVETFAAGTDQSGVSVFGATTVMAAITTARVTQFTIF